VSYIQYNQGGTYYYNPKTEYKNNKIFTTLYRTLGNGRIKLSREDLKKEWRIKSKNRAEEYDKLLRDSSWSRSQLARHLGVSRSWITQVLKNLEK
jgi:DNA-binding MarR family transcriptional regulator